MTQFEIRRRDGLARSGIFTHGETTLETPAVIDPEAQFIDLETRSHSNVPLQADEAFVAAYFEESTGEPIPVHPLRMSGVSSGDAVLFPCWHTALANPRAYADWIEAFIRELPPDAARYAPASALPSNVSMLIATGFDLFDTRAVDLRSAQGLFCTPLGIYPGSWMHEGICACPGCGNGDLLEHNRLALRHEIALAAAHLKQGDLRELIESRCRSDAALVALLRHLDTKTSFTEIAAPIARKTTFRAYTAESMNRPEVIRFARRTITRFTPSHTDTCVLLPCSARKPYSFSQSHKKFNDAIQGRADALIVTSPLGVVPRELEAVYPAAHYDVPVTGYWDHEEIHLLSGILASYLNAHPYERIIAHLEGGAREVAQRAAESAGVRLEETCRDGRPTSWESLDNLAAALSGGRKRSVDQISATIQWQFGRTVDTKGMMIKGKGLNRKVMLGRRQLFSIDPTSGLLRPTFDGWELLPGCYQVKIDDFVPHGDILAPGVISADPGIRDGDEVFVVGEGIVATGRAMMPSDEMVRSKRGVAVRLRKVKKSEE